MVEPNTVEPKTRDKYASTLHRDLIKSGRRIELEEIKMAILR